MLYSNIFLSTDTRILHACIYILDSDAEKEELDPEGLMSTLSHNLNQYWLHIIGLCSCNYIAEVFHQCKHEVREYLVDLVQSNSKVTPEVLEKVKKAVATLGNL